MNKGWKRFNFYEKGLAIFLIFNIIFYVVNEDFLKYIIPKDISGYLFWISLGLYLGFRLCQYEYKRVWNEMQKEQVKKGSNKKMPPGHSPN